MTRLMTNRVLLVQGDPPLNALSWEQQILSRDTRYIIAKLGAIRSNCWGVKS